MKWTRSKWLEVAEHLESDYHVSDSPFDGPIGMDHVLDEVAVLEHLEGRLDEVKSGAGVNPNPGGLRIDSGTGFPPAEGDPAVGLFNGILVGLALWISLLIVVYTVF